MQKEKYSWQSVRQDVSDVAFVRRTVKQERSL